jgi:hypothetical protein
MRERDDSGGWNNRKGSKWKQFGRDHFISTQSIPSQLSAHSRAENAVDPIHVYPGSKAALSAI